jgi:CRP-like cAMP-binding protein
MFLILEGWVKIVIPDSNNDEIIVNQLGPGELVGEMSLIDHKPRSASVIALTNLSALEFSRENFMKILKQHPEIGIHMISAMSNRMRFTLKYLENAVTWSKKIADGDFSFLDQIDKSDEGIEISNSRSDEERSNSFLFTFLNMAKTLQNREKELQDQLLKLTIQINQAKRDKELLNITNTDFFEKLNENIHKIKNNRGKQ